MSDDQFKIDDDENNINNNKIEEVGIPPPIEPKGETDKDKDDLGVETNKDFLIHQLDETKPDKQIKKKEQEAKTEDDFPFSEIDDVFEEMEKEESEQKAKEEKIKEPKPDTPKISEAKPIPSEDQKKIHTDEFADQVFIPAEADIKEPTVEPADEVFILDEADKKEPIVEPADQAFIPEETNKKEPIVEPADQIIESFPQEPQEELELDLPVDFGKKPEPEVKNGEKEIEIPKEVPEPPPKEKEEEDVFVLEDTMYKKENSEQEPEKVTTDSEQESFQVESNQDFLLKDQQEKFIPPPETPDLTSLSDESFSPKVITTVPEIEELTKKMQHPEMRKTGEKDQKKSGYDPSLYPEESPVEVPKEIESKKFYKSNFKEESIVKKSIPKNYLIIGGIALSIIIIASYFLFFSGSKDSDSELKKAPITNLRDKTQIKKGKKPESPVQKDRISPKDRKFNRFVKLARDSYNKGNYEEAKKNAELAAEIKSTNELNTLLKNISEKMEKKAQKLLVQKEKKTPPKPLYDDEEYEGAQKTNTIEAYQKYMELFPAGKHYIRARQQIKKLEAKAKQDLQEEFLSKIKQRKKINLRSQYLRGKKETLVNGINKGKQVRNIFEKKVIDGDKVIIDYNTGLIWHLWKKPMNFEQAKLFAIRRYAGLNKWRLPTSEELASVLKMDFNYFINIPRDKCEMWTGDLGTHEIIKIAWTLAIPSGTPTESKLEELKYLTTVLAVKRKKYLQ